jgi:hypothetical protein
MITAPPDERAIDAQLKRIGTSLNRRIIMQKAAAPVGFGLAAVLTVGLVATDVVGLAGWRGGAEPAAAAALENAASVVSTSDLSPEAGEFLLVETHSVALGFDCRDGEQCAILTNEETSQLWVPQNEAGDWVWFRTFVANGHTERFRAPGGTFYGDANQWNAAYFAALPSNAYLFLNGVYREAIAAGSNPDNYAFDRIADLLRTPSPSADVRAMLLRAVAMIPGVELIDSQATLDGETGVAFGRDRDSELRQEIIIDPATGLLIGERSVMLIASGGDGDDIPAGTVTWFTSVRMSVASSAPEGGTLYGDATVPPG